MKPQRSSASSDTPNVEVFEGGLEDWKQAGHGVVGTGDTR